MVLGLGTVRNGLLLMTGALKFVPFTPSIPSMFKSASVFGTNSTLGRLAASSFLQHNIRINSQIKQLVQRRAHTFRAMSPLNSSISPCTDCGNLANLPQKWQVEKFVPPDNSAFNKTTYCVRVLIEFLFCFEDAQCLMTEIVRHET